MVNLYNFLDGDGLFIQRVSQEIPPGVSDAINRFVNSSVLEVIKIYPPRILTYEDMTNGNS